MRYVITITLLLLLLSSWHAPEPQVEEVVKVEEVASEGMSLADARWMAWELEFQEGLGRVLARMLKLPDQEALEIVKVAYQESNAQGVDVFRTLGFIVAESHGQKEATSHVGARGLMQIMPGTGRFIAAAHSEPWEGTGSLYGIDLNIRYGVWYYSDLLETFEGDENAAIAAYNWGPDHIAFRIRKGQDLPKVYPRKVREAEERVREEFCNENRDLIWRSHSRAERILSDRRNAGQPKDRTDRAGLLRSLPPSP